jgi:hypothetical protein
MKTQCIWETAVQPRTHNTKVKQIHDGTSSMLVAVRVCEKENNGGKRTRKTLLLQFLNLIGITFIGEVYA